jgi:hypothetical protein
MPQNYPTNKRLIPRSVAFTQKTLATSFQSPFDGKQQTVQYSGQYWEATLSYPPLFQSDAEELTGFLGGLNGTVGTFYWKPPARYMVTSSITATMATTSNTFNETNGQIGKFGVDSVASRLVQFTGTSSLFPMLPTGAHTIGNSNGALFRLMSNDLTFTIDEMQLYGISIAIKEAI